MMKRKKRIEKILNINFPEYKLTINDISMLHKGHNNIDGNQDRKTIYLPRKIQSQYT